MRSIFLCLLILIVTISCANAQGSNFWHYWEKGCYYNNSGDKTCGFISEYIKESTILNRGEKYFLFKPDENSDKVKIYAHSIKAFVIGRDSFIVSTSKILDATPFLQVLVDGQMKLFAVREPKTPGASLIPGPGRASNLSAGKTMTSTKNTYYFGLQPNSIAQITSDNFVDAMCQVMADKPDVVKKIKNHTFMFVDIDLLVNYYRTGEASPHL